MKSSPFVVNVGHLLRAPGERRRERRGGPIAGLRVTGSEVPVGADVVVEVMLDAVPGAVVATGTVTAPWRGPCRRCLADAEGTVTAEVREVFEEEPDPEQTYPLTGDQLDLEPLAHDTVLLELPLAPLCREDCAGICPTCGADRNVAPCQCAAAAPDPRWAALDALRDT
ncbi:MAG: YceD family protein [Acidimicrobiales bacterium]